MGRYCAGWQLRLQCGQPAPDQVEIAAQVGCALCGGFGARDQQHVTKRQSAAAEAKAFARRTANAVAYDGTLRYTP